MAQKYQEPLVSKGTWLGNDGLTQTTWSPSYTQKGLEGLSSADSKAGGKYLAPVGWLPASTLADSITDYESLPQRAHTQAQNPQHRALGSSTNILHCLPSGRQSCPS